MSVLCVAPLPIVFSLWRCPQVAKEKKNKSRNFEGLIALFTALNKLETIITLIRVYGIRSTVLFRYKRHFYIIGCSVEVLASA